MSSLGNLPGIAFRRLAILLCLAASLAFGQAGAPAAAPAPAADSSASPVDLVIGNGDLLDVAVFEVPDLSGKIRLTNSGEATFPLIGVQKLAGLSPRAAEQLIREKLISGGYVNDPQVTVQIQEYATQMVSVMGEVMKPGVYPSVGEHRLLEYLSLAQGFTPMAGASITITHKNPNLKPETVPLSKSTMPVPESNPAVYPGDTIFVPRAGIVYVVGEVNRAGGFILDRDGRLSVIKAVSLAQGMTPIAARNKARIIRKTEEGTTDIPVELGRILTAKSPDIQLQDDDVLFIPGSFAKSVTKQTVDAAFRASSYAVYRF